MHKHLLPFTLSLLLAASVTAGELKLWYRQPATKDWTTALPLGNGRLGALLYGGVQREQVMLNELSLWSGWAEPDNDRAGSFAALQRVRQLLREGKREAAGQVAVSEFLSQKGYGKPDFGAYQAFCDVLLDFDGLPAEARDYRRELDLNEAVARVSFRVGETEYQREAFLQLPGSGGRAAADRKPAREDCFPPARDEPARAACGDDHRPRIDPDRPGEIGEPAAGGDGV
jgi:alpha-L-fucosidase 2